jgi:hypothetical protein
MDSQSGPNSAGEASDQPLQQGLPASRRSRLKRYAKWAAVMATVAAAIVVWALEDDVRTLASLRRIEGTNAYVMDYYCDYHLEDLCDGMDVRHAEEEFIDAYFPTAVAVVAKRVRTAFVPEPVEILASDTEFCSTVAYRNSQNEMLVGRNLDWKHDACLVLRVHQGGEVASTSVIDLAYLNLDRDDLMETWLWRRIPLLFAPYYVMDGMNSDGVAITAMTLSGSRPPHDSDKPDIMHGTDMRLVLDDATSTAQAIDILRRYNLHFVESPCHYLIADSGGHSAVVEFLDGQMRVTVRQGPWQVCTNDQIWRASEAESDVNCDRYRRASALLGGYCGAVDVDRIMDVMDEVAVGGWTMWSSVYNLTTGEVLLTHRKGEDRTKRTRLDLN